jgi:hypothetical protein
MAEPFGHLRQDERNPTYPIEFTLSHAHSTVVFAIRQRLGVARENPDSFVADRSPVEGRLP